ncbi:MAG: DinB family protein [uncultured Segetibacter sp.]|uniref:DinB family protein n=1 Tax=uncultured Segetibacter sp. TaxID=481133 RepID=A0A6J4ST11_9BACT|nr:MAG: DinB family protein [uncultured Segetibacter sp.]
MKQIFKEYASYNAWANQKMTEAIFALPGETVQKTIVSSFSSLHLTLLHMWNAESIWWQRINLAETIRTNDNTNSSIKEIAGGLIEQSKQWEAWVEKSTPATFEHEFIYRNSKKEQFKQPVYQVLLHLFNHSTYHRGQLVTMLRQSGAEKIPNGDFIAFSRGKS